MRLIILIFFTLLIFNISCINQDRFERVPSERISDTLFSKSNTPIDVFLNEGFEKKKRGKTIKISKEGIKKKQLFKNVVFITYVDQNFIGLITGLPTFDAGWRYLIFPTYSNLVILDKKTLSIVFKKTVSASVSDLIIRNEYVYFEYGTYPDLKYGRFSFQE